MFILYIFTAFSLESIDTIRIGRSKHIHILYCEVSYYIVFQKSCMNLLCHYNMWDCLFPSILNAGFWPFL